MLLEVRGQVRAATGDPEGALTDWRHAVDLDHNIGPVYSSAFLLERLGWLQDAAEAWEFIIDWCQSSRGGRCGRAGVSRRLRSWGCTVGWPL